MQILDLLVKSCDVQHKLIVSFVVISYFLWLWIKVVAAQLLLMLFSLQIKCVISTKLMLLLS